MQTLIHLLPASRQLAVLLSLRLLPFAVSAVLSQTLLLRQQVLAFACYVVFPVLACILGALWSILLIMLGSVYYLLICLGVNWLSKSLQAEQVTRGAVLVILFTVFLLLPGVLLPGLAALAFLSVGWELALSSYSYCIETSRPGTTRAPLGECLFFLIVNPTLVYTARGIKVATPAGPRGVLRAAGGASIMLMKLSVLTPAVVLLRRESSLSLHTHIAGATLTLCGVIQFLSVYAAHSGLASIQIGMMRQLGWVVPERYHYPFLAVSPMDFWRRWNTYVRVWLEAYVFLPLARRVARSSRRRSGQVAAAIATLIASGLIHDAFAFAGHQTLRGSYTTLFLSAGALLALWRLARAMGETLRRRLNGKQCRRLELVAQWSGRMSLAGAVVAAAVIWGHSR